MAKRFTDTDKWAKPEFSEYSLKQKLIWLYLLDNCDHAGVWDINCKLLSFQIGEPTSIEEILDAFGSKVFLSDNKLIIKPFVEFQYGELNPDNKVHKSVILRLEKLAPHKPLDSSNQGAKDKDKDKEKDKDKDFEGGAGETFSAAELSELVAAWGETLKHFKISKDPKLDELEIARLMKLRGFDKTRLALIGARFEEPTKTFTPSKHLSIWRLSRPDKFEKFVNLGAHNPYAYLEEDST